MVRNSILVILSLLFLSSCSNPFGQGSLIDSINTGIDSINTGIESIFGKTESALVAGGTQNFQTGSAYKGSISIGNYMNQSQQMTNGGYRVITTIK